MSNLPALCPGQNLLVYPSQMPAKERTFATLLLNSIVIYFWASNTYLLPALAFYLYVGLTMCFLAKKIEVIFNKGAQDTISQQMGACFSLFNDPEKMSMTIKGMYVHGYSKINNFIGEIRKIVLLQDKMLTFKTLISLYFVMKVLSLFGDYFGYCIMVTAFMWFDKIVLALQNLYQQTAGKAAELFKQIPAYKVQKEE